MIHVLKGLEINKDHVKQALDLDFESYADEYHLDYDKCYGYLDKNPYIYTMILDDDKVIGYINFSPINNDAYNQILNGEKDNFLTFDDVETYDFNNNKEYNLYFSSIVIKESYRGMGLSKLLIEGLIDLIISLEKQGIKIKRILADCVSKEGEIMVSKLGLKPIKPTNRNSITYECYYHPFNGNITKYNQKLIELNNGEE